MDYYSTLTIDQLVQRTLGLLQSYHENGQVDTNFIEDRIVSEILPKFKNQETWIPHECWFPVCGKEVELPVKISDIIDVKIYDTADKLVWSSWKSRFTHNVQVTMPYPPVWDKGAYDLYGHTLKFYTEDYDGFTAKVEFYTFLRDEEDGSIIVPESYSGSITKYAAAEWLLTTGNQVNTQLAAIYRQDAKNLRNHLKGEANKQSQPQWEVTSTFTKPSVYNTGARYIRSWRPYTLGF